MDGAVAAAGELLSGLLSAGRFADAEMAARALLARRPNSPAAWTALAQSLWLQGKDALPALERSAQLLPDDADVQGNLGTALMVRGRPAQALQYCRRALELRPQFAEAHNNMGSALRDLGRLPEAADSYRRALGLNPTLAVAHCNLGHVLRLQGSLEEAEEHYRAATRIQPDLAEAHTGLGSTLQDLCRFPQALESHRRALALKPHAVDCHFQLGCCLMDLWLLAEAETSFRRALSLQEDHAGVHDKLSATLRLQGRSDEALQSCRRALELDPDHLEALLSAAQLAADRGDFAEAERIFRRAAALAPQSAEALAGIAGVRKMTAADAAWVEAALSLASLPLPAPRAAKLRYAIGKYFDDTGETGQAFAHYRIANDLSKRNGAPHDRSQWQEEVDAIIRRFDTVWLERQHDLGNPSSRPVLIVGMPRSGTTLIEQILGAHPAVHGAGELAFWVPALSRYSSEEDFGHLDRMELNRLARDYLCLLEEKSATASQVVDKMPGNFKCVGLIHAAFPRARIINVLRNPMDTCLSVYFQDFNAMHSYAKDLEDLAHYYRQYLKLMSHWRNVLPKHAFLPVVYEDLIDDPETWTRKLLQFIGQPWDARCLEFDTVNASAGVILTFSQWRARQKISKSSVGRWRRYEQFLGPLLPLAEEQAASFAAAAERSS